MKDPTPKKARPLLRSAALAVVAIAGCDDKEGPQVFGNPKSPWFDAGFAGQDAGNGAAGTVASSSNPKSSWYDSGLAEDDAGEDSGLITEPETE